MVLQFGREKTLSSWGLSDEFTVVVICSVLCVCVCVCGSVEYVCVCYVGMY